MKKKIIVLLGSRRKNGNTVTFIRHILNFLPKKNFEIMYIFPQDFIISPCVGCGNCFDEMKCSVKDDIFQLQTLILEADLLIVASPVYLHYMTADLKLILDKCSWWTHTLMLQGKPTIVLSTCDSNGHQKVIEALSEIMTYMGGNVIATANASFFPNRINNEVWLDSVATEISKRIIKYVNLPPQSNAFLEKYFDILKHSMKMKNELLNQKELENGEVNYWISTGMLMANSYSEYLSSRKQLM